MPMRLHTDVGNQSTLDVTMGEFNQTTRGSTILFSPANATSDSQPFGQWMGGDQSASDIRPPASAMGSSPMVS